MILAFAHPGIVVPDLTQAIDFYEKAFGFRLLNDKEGWENSPDTDRAIGRPNSSSRGAMLAGHNCYLELFEYGSPEQTATPPGQLLAHEPGIVHIAFYVDGLKKEFERFLGVGGEALGELAMAPQPSTRVILSATSSSLPRSRILKGIPSSCRV